jgi:hypothetical protein
MLRTCVIGIVLALAGTSCSKSDDNSKTTDKAAAAKPHDDEGKADLDALARLKDEMCACKDATCGKAVEEKLMAKRKEMDATYADSHNKSIMHYAMETEMAAMKCRNDLK